MSKKSNDMEMALKALKRMQREEEIKMYGKTICYSRVERNPKAYSRKIKHKGNFFEK